LFDFVYSKMPMMAGQDLKWSMAYFTKVGYFTISEVREAQYLKNTSRKIQLTRKTTNYYK